MNKITTLYIDKAIHIYDRVPDLQKRAKEEADSFKKFVDFRDYIIIENAEIINQFKNISSNICQIIDNENFDISEISSKFHQIKIVRELTNQMQININETKRLLISKQGLDEITEFEELIEYCENNMTFGAIGDCKAKLEKGNKQLQEFIAQLKTVKDLASQIKVNTDETKRFLISKQGLNEIVEIEELIEYCDNNMTFGTIGDCETKLKNANQRLQKFIVHLKIVKEFVNQIKININETKSFFTDKFPNEVIGFEKLIEYCNNTMAFGTIDDYKVRLENANKQLQEFIVVKKLESSVKLNISKVKTEKRIQEEMDKFSDNITKFEKMTENIKKSDWQMSVDHHKIQANKIKNSLINRQQIVAGFEKLIVNSDNNLTFGTKNNYKPKLEDANKQLLNFIDAKYIFGMIDEIYRYQHEIRINKCILETNWMNKGLCRHCGRRFSLFSKKCNSCGEAKDY